MNQSISFRSNIIFPLILTLLVISNSFAEQGQSVFNVKYISSGHIYIDGGSADGLTSGDTLRIIRNDTLIARILTSYTSEHSSSCVVLDKTSEIQVGDKALASINIIMPEYPERVSVESPVEQDQPAAITASEVVTEKISSRISGRVSLGYYVWNDMNSSDLDFSQPSMGLRLNVRNLWGSPVSLNIRSRTRYNRRTKPYTSSVNQNELRNRIYEFSLDNEDADGSGFRFGRIIPRGMSGVGYLDGIMFNRKLTEVLRSGIFAGAQPQWQYASFQTSLQKYGFFISAEGEPKKGLRLESTLAAAGEYHSGELSREFLHFRNRLDNGGTISFYQSADIDINRSWRHEKTGEAIAISNFYISTRYRLGRRVSVSLSYDNRKRYWNYDLRALADSLFDDLARTGLKSSINIKLPANFDLASNYAISKREGLSENAVSYTLGASKSRLTRINLNAKIGYSAFTNEYSDGMRLSYDLGRYSKRGDYLAVGYGVYRYTYKSINTLRSSRWIEGKLTIRLARSILFSGDFQRSVGDDIHGITLTGDLGYSFR